MILVKEITKWNADFQCNHTYLLNDSMDKVIGYFKWNNPKDFVKCSKPMMFDTRYRKFKTIRRIPEGNTRIVRGSSGNEYVLTETENGLSCSCSGFKFRGHCRHLQL